MLSLFSVNHSLPRLFITALAGVLLTSSIQAATIEGGDVTATLGPSFFVDDVAAGGGDVDISHGATASFIRLFNGLLTPNQGPTRVVLTGFGFFTHPDAGSNDASSVAVTFTYLGADGAINGGDDVPIGTATGNLVFSGGKEYVFEFDTPLTADLTITATRFRIQVAPTKAANVTPPDTVLKLKSASLISEPSVTGAKLSVAGVASPIISPQRVNLAKFQTVTAASAAGQRVGSYLTDGFTGNDNRWQSENWQWNTAVVDFPFPVEVGSAHLFTGVDDTLPLTKFAIQYWNGSAWIAVPGADISGNSNVERNLVFTNPVTAARFRLIAQEAPHRIRELALYPPNGPSGYPLGTDLTINLAYQRPTIASANTAGNFALEAVDGRTHSGSMWQTSTVGVNTLDIDLRVNTKIGSAHVYSGTTGNAPLSDFVLKSWNGTAWVNIPGASVTGNSTADRVVSFTPVTTSQVRLEFTNAGTTSIRELCIFPANTGNVGYPIQTNIISSGTIGSYETYNDSFHLITNPVSGRKFSVPGNGQPSLDPAGLTFGQSQYQVLLNLSNGTYRLRNRATGNCLSGAQLSKTPGLLLTDAPYSALPHQDWILAPLGNGHFQLVNQWSGLVVDSQGGAATPGTPLVQNVANGSDSQRWQISHFAFHPKKGLGHSSLAGALAVDWAYNWGRTSPQPFPADASFHPMQWGNFSWDIGSTQGPLWQEYSNWRKRSDGIHLLGFNEPDRTDQSNIAMSQVISLWPRLQEMDLPLASPSPGTIGGDGGWLDSFYTQADALGYRVDYTAVHTYPGPSGGLSNNLVNFVNNAFTYNSRNRPVWLTEFSFVDWGKNQSWSEEDNYNCLAEFLWRAEGLQSLRKYALFVFTEDAEYPQPANPWQNFTPAPRSNSYDINGNLTAFGKLYAAWDNDTAVRTNKTYYIHHKGFSKRLANNTSTTNLAGRNIRIDGDIVHWQLVSAGSANLYYVVSSLDGRRLSSNGTAASFAASNTTGAAVEWSLAESQHGWHFLDHPSSTKRLQLSSFDSSNNFSSFTMAANTVTSDNVQWRFIVPVANNAAPVLATIPPQSLNEGSQLSFTASATDDGLPSNTLIYSLIDAPSGASINASTGVFTWTPGETRGPDIYQFTVRASDGRLSHNQPVSVTVNEVNIAPVLAVIPAQTVNEGSQLSFTASATDADLPANTLTYSLIGAPSGASILGSTGVFGWTPTESQGPGTFNFTVRVNDGTANHDRSVSVTVNEVSSAPVLAVIPAQVVNEGSILSFTASATDTDLPANTLTYSLIGAPGGASIHGSTGVFAWTPTELQGPGSFNFTVRVSDGILTHDRLVSVIVNEVSAAPVLAEISAQAVNEGSLLTFTASAIDVDFPATTLTYSLVNAPGGAGIDGSTGVFNWTPTESQGPGSINITVRVSDGVLVDEQLVSVTIQEVNMAPVLAAIPAQTVNEGSGLMFTASASDGDLPGNVLTYSLVGEPSGASIHGSTGVFSWTPSEAQGPGSFDFTVRVSDGELTHEQPVSVTVQEVNTAPVLAAIPPQTVIEEMELTFTASASDEDLPANNLTYSLIGEPVGASINASTGVFSWTPSEVQGPGSFNFTVRASDGALTHEQPLSITVESPLPSPELDGDGDGLSDLLEYAFVTDPEIPNGNPFKVVATNAGTITLGFPWNWQAAGLSWQIRHGNDLSDVVNWPVVAPGTTTIVREGNLDRITVSPAMAHPSRGFYVLEVNGN